MPNPSSEAQKTLKEFSINKAHIDVEMIAKNLGAKVIYKEYDTKDLCGMIYRESDRIIIGINSSHPPTRQRFTLAHEIGHMIMHDHLLGNVHVDEKFGVKLKRDGRSALGEEQIEIEANKFAAELLMPEFLLKEDIKDAYYDIEEGPTELAEKYQVSRQAMSIRLSDLLKNCP